MYEHGLITPVVALVIWSLVMWVWMYATRIPAMQKAGIKPNAANKAAMASLPSAKVSDNYNHLMEQPTLFYAICFALQFLEQTQDINIGLAWAYVALRVVHSLIQATTNFIPLRFLVFSLASLVLVALTFHAAMAVGIVQFNFVH